MLFIPHLALLALHYVVLYYHYQQLELLMLPML
jgi:hypothetical protein